MSTRAEFFQSMYPGLSDGEVIDELIKASIVKILISFHLNGSFNDLIVDFLTK